MHFGTVSLFWDDPDPFGALYNFRDNKTTNQQKIDQDRLVEKHGGFFVFLLSTRFFLVGDGR